MNKIAFRADGGEEIGMGHMMRCLALAKAFPAGIKVYFITKDNQSVKALLKRKNIEILSIDKKLSINDEIKSVKELILSNKINILITDSYQIDREYLLKLKKVVGKLVSIHDSDPFIFPSDMIINGNIYASNLDYNSKGAELLLGNKYTLMREEFANLPHKKIQKKVDNILVTVGGGDPLNLTPKILASLARLSKENRNDLHIDVVIGPSFNNIAEIIEIVRSIDLEISLHFKIKKMSQLMLNSDLAISAGGGTLYELAACGIPAIVLLQAENQILAAEKMDQKGSIINLGFGDQIELEELISTIGEVIKDFSKREEMSRIGQQLVDGLGAKRCVRKILSI
ncbi:UDP-2,4-diacetamido-2,4,6-trideoxy-beta-L-altropyranose hydrolase [Orenia marismortui]|uniref:UDP-2,4-diacetamido-2,4, 6-trideoxy-beta-L-altropyranose hydrolase n=1 Tax=Orenia marismortui TaxID=46469 RepID=A0A4R8HFP7_9FIRM|nr:UDP-2,4-diacetamido-2,4,6-trideoxy-beta-L-altropyranose hydrolase [Orenia marismortui]TDX58935.1 UDP-2,4-diacetamido-2,4,6-trideoxy-beta-L-altropyranose hydrolase [Orenia marismortui]